jgi:ribonuclease Z
MDQSDLDHKLVPLEDGEEYQLPKGLRVRAFRTYHVVPSQVRANGIPNSVDSVCP